MSKGTEDCFREESLVMLCISREEQGSTWAHTTSDVHTHSMKYECSQRVLLKTQLKKHPVKREEIYACPLTVNRGWHCAPGHSKCIIS